MANPGNLASNVNHLSLSAQHHHLSPWPANPLPSSASPLPSSASPLPDPVPYDIQNEGAPPHQFFDPLFQNALKGAVGIAKELANLIGNLQGTEPPYYEALTRLLEHARRLGDFTGSETRTIAVLGDSGQGKSSLINSLLHYPGVAQTGDIGSACTSVITEYRQKTSQLKAWSDHVKQGLQQAYASKVPGEILNVFCVSNTMYEKYAPKGNRELVAASEIPDVRRFCHSITAEARYREACHFMHSSMPSLLNTLKLSINSYTTRAVETKARDKELKDKICDALRDATTQITSGVIELAGSFKVCFKDVVLEISAGKRTAVLAGRKLLHLKAVDGRR